MIARTRPCPTALHRERLRKAEEFWRVARDTLALTDDPADVSSAVTTLLVTAGIAASDAICCQRLGVFAQGEDHKQAVSLLDSAEGGAGKELSALLDLKSKAAYSHHRISAAELRRAVRAAEHLVLIARRVSPPS